MADDEWSHWLQTKAVPRVDFVVLLILFAVSLVFNVLNYRRIEKPRPGKIPPIDHRQGATQSVSPLLLRDIHGNALVVDWASAAKPTVLFVLSPDCSWCAANMPNLRYLFTARETSHRFIGISITTVGLAEFVSAYRVPFPVYIGPARETIRELGLGVVPQTLVIATDGTILAKWEGAYDTKLLPRIESFFAIRGMPGVPSAVKPAD